jgi:hypothetical protein
MTGKPKLAIKDELRRHKTHFWGRDYIITPRLVEWVHGDGLQVIYFMPLNTRPNYYVVRIDSKVSLDNCDDGGFHDTVLDDLYEHIEEEYGVSSEEWTSNNGRTYQRHNPWPALSDDSGSCWGLLQMMTGKPTEEAKPQ